MSDVITLPVIRIERCEEDDMGQFTWADLIRHLTDWRRKDWPTDPERDAYRLENLEWVLQTMLEKLRDQDPEK